MTGWLIENAFLHTKKFSDQSAWYVRTAKRQGIDLRVFGDDRFLAAYGGSEDGLTNLGNRPDFVLFLDKDVTLARAFERKEIPVFNSPDAIAACDDKSVTHRLLSGQKIPMPLTFSVPMTFPGVGYSSFSFLDEIQHRMPYPFVVKECFGSFGAQVYLVRDRREAELLLEKLAGKPLLIQEFIKESMGKDLRIHIVGGKPVASMMRYNDRDFRANVTNGGRMKPWDPDDRQAELAVRVCEILGLDFAGVDLLYGKDGRPILCEVNSNAHIQNIYDCTGINVADSIIRYIGETCRDRGIR